MKNIALILTLALAACGPSQPSSEQIARETAKAVIRPIVGAQFPGVPTDVVVDCVIDNASGQEILQIASSAALGSTTDSLSVIMPILTRPNTIQCVAAKTFGA